MNYFRQKKKFIYKEIKDGPKKNRPHCMTPAPGDTLEQAGARFSSTSLQKWVHSSLAQQYNWAKQSACATFLA